ncbi:DUF305 domain-containing protein [Longimicrobium terrae]|uniref:Uncharacterized protein (DUF305 family) n=1 Tax=Longimicrobium terrae TaxID=1639882 RepID=A0A841GV77_9BACT|nr:DUF305 domain-containing protein [Longimicrobium terrae]MBB4634849.1 uncharacterized protein (DUF305 family) [Longimicrobium terrae]MBB6069244.1 uncharacterized protein (DUF305 family) [Longimicrobium terrae]NNC31946.1 DUF305 domain-containing protein [Longimicrobium terrae]
MKMIPNWTGAALLALVAASPAAAQGTHVHSGMAAAAPTDSARWTPADARFMTMMIGHHAQAIEMAVLAPTNGASPGVLRLAERIKASQEDEIATMQRWLAARRQPVPDPMHGGMAGMDHGAGHEGHGTLMAGMLTPEQMAELRQARGSEFDEMFLNSMIQHHRGAVSMVRELFSTWGAGQDETVFKFASDVNVDQTTEINRMQRMLAGILFGATAP